MSFKFKVGDRVKAIAACDNDTSYIGKTGKVVGVSPVHRRLKINVKFDNANYNWWCEESSLELIVDSKHETPKQEPATITIAGLDRKYKYIARDKDGSLFAYVEKPVIDVGGLQWYGKEYKALDSELLKEIKWGDEPVEINQGD